MTHRILKAPAISDQGHGARGTPLNLSCTMLAGLYVGNRLDYQSSVCRFRSKTGFELNWFRSGAGTMWPAGAAPEIRLLFLL
jgi:hypothetical protein